VLAGHSPGLGSLVSQRCHGGGFLHGWHGYGAASTSAVAGGGHGAAA
jgi:hypothetical protein